jgi:hypothetical protein
MRARPPRSARRRGSKSTGVYFFGGYGLVAIPTRVQTLFFSVQKAVLPRGFPYVVFYCVRENDVVVSQQDRTIPRSYGYVLTLFCV